MKGPVRSLTRAAAAAVGSLAVLLANLSGAHAVRPDECEQQRKLYPEVWADVSHEQALFDCASHYAGSFYNQAPRMSAFEGDAYTCRPVK